LLLDFKGIKVDKEQICPKCGGKMIKKPTNIQFVRRMWVLKELIPWAKTADAFICEKCGYIEFYASR